MACNVALLLLAGMTGSIVVVCAQSIGDYDAKYGTYVGDLRGNQLSGKVYVASPNAFVIRSLQNRGGGNVAIYVGASRTLSPSTGTELQADGGGQIQSGQDAVVLRLPSALPMANVQSLGVFDKASGRAISDVLALNPRSMTIPQPVTLVPLTPLDHDVSSGPVQVLNAKQLRIPNLNYDGQAPDAFFWVGKTASGDPDPQGTIVPYLGSATVKIPAFKSQTVDLTLPADMTVQDINYLSVWCRAYTVDFGHLKIPRNLIVPPAIVALNAPTLSTARLPTFANCERKTAGDRTIEISWYVQTTPPYLYVQLESAQLTSDEYMAFGISGDTQGVLMKGGDVAVTFIDANGQGNAIDYSLEDYSQCSHTTGACPDEELGGRNDVELIASSIQSGVSRVVYRKPLDRGDRFDIVVDVNNPMYTIWAIGPLNSKRQVAYHGESHALRTDDTRVIFSRSAISRCSGFGVATPPPMPPKLAGPVLMDAVGAAPGSGPADSANRGAVWQPTQLFGDRDNRKFLVVIGPAGGRKGYTGITGIQSWGIAFYVNGRIIPELILQRGIEYEFEVYTGDDVSNSAKYHPVYITTDPEGGFGQKTPQEQAAERYLAGVERTQNSYTPTAFGSFCELKAPLGQDAERFNTFEEYNRTLTLQCKAAAAPGQFPVAAPGILRFKPDSSTPDIAYYQCYIHRNLGWRIRIVNNLNDVKRAYLDGTSSANIRNEFVSNKASAVRYAGVVTGMASLAALLAIKRLQ